MQFQIPIASACSKGGLLEVKGHKPSISTAVFINLVIFTHINISVVAEVVVMLVCVWWRARVCHKSGAEVQISVRVCDSK